jgi:hypothetical protein
MSDEWSDTQLRIQAMELAVKVWISGTTSVGINTLANSIYHFLLGPIIEAEPDESSKK